jgi:hypothetical protein
MPVHASALEGAKNENLLKKRMVLTRKEGAQRKLDLYLFFTGQPLPVARRRHRKA